MTKPTLLYDETCGFCTSIVQWVQRQKRGGDITVMSCQFAQLTQKFPVTERDCATSIQLFQPGGERLTKGQAVASVFGVLWNTKWPARIASIPGIRHILDIGYSFVAVNRHRLPGIKQMCASEGQGTNKIDRTS